MFVSWGDKKIIYKNKPSGFGLGLYAFQKCINVIFEKKSN